MKKLFYSLFAFVFLTSQSLNAAGYLATYSMKVSNPAAYVEALDELMNTDWGKSFAGDVSLHQYAFNGYDDATHVVVLNYENPESLGTGTESFTDPVFLSFFAETASIAEPVEQSLNMKLISVYNENADEDQVYSNKDLRVWLPVSSKNKNFPNENIEKINLNQESMKQVITQNLLCGKDYLIKLKLAARAVSRVNGQQEKLKC